MARPIRIVSGDLALAAELGDSPTAKAIYAALPIQGSGSRWGDEIYFSTPVNQALEPEARAEMAVGELAYWPPGKAFCIFFGPTPASTDQRPRGASELNPVGRILDDISPLRDLPDGAEVRVESAG